MNAFNAYTAINKAGTTVNPSYNANGELEYDGEYNYIWDAWGRLTMITDDNYFEDPVARFVYDADNRRVRRMDFYSHEEGTNWAAHVYDYAYSGWRVLEEEKYRVSYDNSSGYIDAFDYGLGFRQNIYGNYLDEVIAVQIDGNGDGEAHEAVHDENSATGPDQRYYYCHNTLYSVIAITDEDADLVERYAYDPYGQTHIYNAAGTKIADSLIDNVFTFTGQRFDPSLNANGYPRYLYYKNRYYYVDWGRFMSRDPINSYSIYEQNNRSDYSNPSPHRASNMAMQDVDSTVYADDNNLYCYVKNNATNFIDLYGLESEKSDKICGPDITGWLVNQMGTNLRNPIFSFHQTGTTWFYHVPVFGWYASYLNGSEFRDLVRAGGEWDFKNNQSFKSDCCPVDCPRTVTLCGACMDYDVAGNIHYGFIGKAFGFRDHFLKGQAAAAQSGGVDPDHDVAAIELGIELYDTANFNICSVIGKYSHRLNYGPNNRAKNCKPCDDKYSPNSRE